MTAWAAKQKAEPMGVVWQGWRWSSPAVSEYTGDLWEMWLQRELRARPAWALERGVGTLVGSKGGLHVLIYSFIHSANMYCVQTLCQALPWVPGVH